MRLRLKKEYLILITVVLTLSIENLIIRPTFENINKKIEQCDTLKNHTCSIYELRDYFYNNR